MGSKGDPKGIQGGFKQYTLVSINILIGLFEGHVTNWDDLLFQILSTYSNIN